MDHLTCTLQIFIDHAWRDAAALELSGEVHAVTAAIAAMALPLATLFDDARALGIEERFLVPMNKTLDNVRAQLESL